MVSILAMIIIIGVAATLIYRKLKLESELDDSWWFVNWEEIRFADKGRAARASTTSLGTSQATLTSAARSVSGLSSINSSMNTTCANIHGVLVGVYKVSRC